LESTAETQPQLHPALLRISGWRRSQQLLEPLRGLASFR
jgi:hypothetical protein